MRIQNSSTIKEIRSAACLSISEGFPQDLSNQIIPVINVNPKDYNEGRIFAHGSSVAAGTVTIYTCSSTLDTFIMSCSYSFSKNVACDIASGRTAIQIIGFDGVTYAILSLAVLTLTAERDSISISFNKPLHVKKGSVIQIVGAFAAGAMARSYIVSGYEIESFEN